MTLHNLTDQSDNVEFKVRHSERIFKNPRFGQKSNFQIYSMLCNISYVQSYFHYKTFDRSLERKCSILFILLSHVIIFIIFSIKLERKYNPNDQILNKSKCNDNFISE